MDGAGDMADAPGWEALSGLPSRLVPDESRRLGPDAALRSTIDPATASFLLPPTPSLGIVMVTSGSYVLRAGPHGRSRLAFVSPGSVSVNAPGRDVSAGWVSEDGSRLTSTQLHVGPGILTEIEDSWGRAERVRPDFLHLDDSFVRASMRTLSEGARRGAPQLHLDAVVQALVGRLLLIEQPRERRRQGLTERDLDRVVEYMRAHLAEPLTLVELAGVLHLSASQFLRRFGAATGQSPMRVLTSVRIEHAREILRRGDEPVGMVAIRCGYGNASAFGSAFRRATGVTPLAYRRAASEARPSQSFTDKEALLTQNVRV